MQLAEVTKAAGRDTPIAALAIESTEHSDVDLDIVAHAITPALLQPYVAPQRPISLGTAATHYLRASYTPRLELDDAARVPAHQPFAEFDAIAHHGVAALAGSIASALGAAAITGIDWSDAALPHGDVTAWRDSVVVCADALCRTADPTGLLSLLARIQRDAAVLVIAVPLREFTMTIDDIGPPAGADRVRQWAFPEMQAFLDSAGLDVVFGGLVPATASDPAGQTGVFVTIRPGAQG